MKVNFFFQEKKSCLFFFFQGFNKNSKGGEIIKSTFDKLFIIIGWMENTTTTFPFPKTSFFFRNCHIGKKLLCEALPELKRRVLFVRKRRRKGGKSSSSSAIIFRVMGTLVGACRNKRRKKREGKSEASTTFFGGERIQCY